MKSYWGYKSYVRPGPMLNIKLTTGIFKGCFFLLIMLCLGQLHTHTQAFSLIYHSFWFCVFMEFLCKWMYLCVMCSYAFSVALLPFFWLFVCLFIHIFVLFYVLSLLLLDVCSFPKEKESTVWFLMGRDMSKIWSYLGEVKSQPEHIG